MTLSVGDTARITKRITDEVVRGFADATGDHNPVHLDDEYARTTRFGGRIAHGMLAASLISSVLGNHLPGPGTIYLSQSLKFKAAVFLGDEITAEVKVTGIREDKPIITLETMCFNHRGEPVVNGEAVVMFTGAAQVKGS